MSQVIISDVTVEMQLYSERVLFVHVFRLIVSPMYLHRYCAISDEQKVDSEV